MKTLKTLAAAGMIASTMALAPVAAQAQTAQAQTAQAQTASSGFDGYRVLAVTAGVVAGAAIAAVVTDGLIIPAYVYAMGGTGAGGAAAGGAAAGGAASGMIGSWGPSVMHAGYQTFRGGMRILGAVGGGFYADAWYAGR